MELINLEGLTLGSIIAGILSPAAIVVASQIAKWSGKVRFLGRIAFLVSNKFSWRLAASIIFSVAVASVAHLFSLRLFGHPVNAPFAGALTMVFLLLYWQWKFAKIGMHAAQLSVTRGTNYREALDLCRDSFSFLGTGAFKLTSEKNFKTTMLRCNADNQRPVRFLLSNPENPLIAEAEKKAGVSPGTYKQNVVKSLRNLKRLRDDENARFDVRFYLAEKDRDFENFRMMLIDDDILLLSYNVYGRDEAGRSTAQIAFFKSAMTSSTDNFYFAFQGYFERLWQSSPAWDFKEHV